MEGRSIDHAKVDDDCDCNAHAEPLHAQEKE